MRKVIRGIIGCVLLQAQGFGYYFGIHSFDNRVEGIAGFIERSAIMPHTIGLIFHSYGPSQQSNLTGVIARFGTGVSYHITLGPANATARMVANGTFDETYLRFFADIKAFDATVYLRTMHEMNGGRYPWSGDPEGYQDAWKRVRNLAEQAGVLTGISGGKLSMIFCVNARDMPAISPDIGGHQGAKLIQCTQKLKEKNGCLTREDYYPGDEYIDYMGVTAFNRGKATSQRDWLTINQLLNDKRFLTRDRLNAVGKPIIIDEVGTSTVWYNGKFDQRKSIANYINNHPRKNKWIADLASWSAKQPNLHLVMYFNKDVTQQLQMAIPGEAEWAVWHPRNKFFYEGIRKLYELSQK